MILTSVYTINVMFCLFVGYECEPHNNPADFFLDVINGDAMNQKNKSLGEWNSSAWKNM